MFSAEPQHGESWLCAARSWGSILLVTALVVGAEPAMAAASLPPARPTTTSAWPALPAVADVEVLPMVPEAHASRLGAAWVAVEGSGWSGPLGSIASLTSINFSDLIGAGGGGRIEGGWRLRRDARIFAAVEQGGAFPGALLPATTTSVTTTGVSLGWQNGVTDAAWQPKVYTRAAVRLSDERVRAGSDELYFGYLGFAVGIGVELRLTGDLLLLGGVDYWQLTLPVYGGGRVVDVDGRSFIVKDYGPTGRTDSSAYLGVVYEWMKE